LASFNALKIEPLKFPRVKVFLDSDDLGVADDCQILLDAIEKDGKPDDIAKFYRQYGKSITSSLSAATLMPYCD
jgi:hypothetical protein